jgi:HlyD family secretion protein
MSISFAKIMLVLSLALPAGLLERCTGADQATALGVLARERVALTATVSEIVVELPLPEGSPVRQGDVLVRLDDRIQKAKLLLAQAELASAQANLEKLQSGARAEEITIARARVDGAGAELKDADASYERNLALFAKQAISQARLDQDQARRDAASATLRSAEASLRELENGTRPEDLRIAEASVAAATAQLSAEARRLDDLVVVASRSGTLDSLPWNLGERVSAGSPVAVLLAGEVPFARVYVPEPYRVRIKAGDTLTVHVDGIDEPFEGTVQWISSEPAFTPYYALNQADRARLMYLAEIALPKSAADLPVGIPAQADMP